MFRLFFKNLAALFLGLYLLVFPGSTLTVALDQVPAWGTWMGGALLVVQGLAAVCWLIGCYGWHGGLAGLIGLLLAWGVEHIGETTGFPFGLYAYTELLQPQVFGAVPLPIICAWLMVALGSWQLAQHTDIQSVWLRCVLAATLVLMLDLQIETVATRIHPYWTWLDTGPYYGVPIANFIAWWFVGLVMALILSALLAPRARVALPTPGQEQNRSARGTAPRPLFYLPKKEYFGDAKPPRTSPVKDFAPALLPMIHMLTRDWSDRAIQFLPGLLYLLSTIMFTTINLARGYWLAGLVGMGVLVISAWFARGARVQTPASGQTSGQSPAGHAPVSGSDPFAH